MSFKNIYYKAMISLGLKTIREIDPEEQTDEICLIAARKIKDWDEYFDFLRFVTNQTEEICLAAVEVRPIELKSVRNQTDRICLAAVKRNGMVLEHVKNQTKEICLAAVKQNGCALEYVEIKNQTDEICLAAVAYDGSYLKYVKNQTYEICLAAIKELPTAFTLIKNQTEEICLAAVRNWSGALKYVENQTEEICLEAVRQDVNALEYVQNQTDKICSLAISKWPGSIILIKSDFNNYTKKDIIMAYKYLLSCDDDNEGHHIDNFFKNTLKFLSKLSDEEFVKTVDTDFKPIFEKKQILSSNEYALNIKEKAEMLKIKFNSPKTNKSDTESKKRLI